MVLAGQLLVDTLAERLQVTVEVVHNHGVDEAMASELGAEWSAAHQLRITMVYRSEELAGEGSGQGVGSSSLDASTRPSWHMYLHSIRRLLRCDSAEFDIAHITGDLWRLTPTACFAGFDSGEAVVVPLIAEFWVLFETDFMPRWYIDGPGADARVICSMDTEDPRNYCAPIAGQQWKRTPNDHNVLMSASARFNKTERSVALHESADSVERWQVVPTPRVCELDSPATTAVDVSNLFLSIAPQSLPHADTAELLRKQLLQAGLKLVDEEASATCVLCISTGGIADWRADFEGGYTLRIAASGGCTVVGHDPYGALLGTQTLLCLLQRAEQTAGCVMLPTLQVADAPRLAYRGVQVDVARHFRSKAQIVRLLDQMLRYKLNKLHLSLTNDEGWRVEIDGLPELTAVGGQRQHDLSERTGLLPQLGSGPTNTSAGSSGWYTSDDYIEIVKAALIRGIEVIPEVNMPAHARAAVVSMEARYHAFMEEGDEAAASEYRLLDPDDTSECTTVQFYDRRSFLNPCLPSTLRFVETVVKTMVAMHAAAGAPLRCWHYGGDEAKNIHLGPGFQDLLAPDPVQCKGMRDLSKESYLLHSMCVVPLSVCLCASVCPRVTSVHCTEQVSVGRLPGGHVVVDKRRC